MELYNYEEKIERVFSEIKQTDEKTAADIREFTRRLQTNGHSKGRIYKYVHFLRTLRKKLGKDFREASKNDVENLVIKINEGNYTRNFNGKEKAGVWKEATKSDFKKMLKFYFRWMKFGKLEGKYPEEVEDVKVTMKKNLEPPPEQFLTKEEVELLASKTENPMWHAFVLCLYETGRRISEFLNIRIKDISFDEYGCFILVSGKTGWRRVRVVDYSKDLTKWLDSHPLKIKSDSFVWINPRDNRRIIPHTAYAKLAEELPRKAGLSKKCNPHAFRHAQATRLASKLTEQQLKNYFGWTKASDMAATYVHLSGADVDKALLAARGIKINEEQQPTQPSVRNCYKCGEPNSNLSHFCRKCNSPLDMKIIMEIDDHREKFDEFLKEFLVHYSKQNRGFKKAFVGFVKEKKAGELFRVA